MVQSLLPGAADTRVYCCVAVPLGNHSIPFLRCSVKDGGKIPSQIAQQLANGFPGDFGGVLAAAGVAQDIRCQTLAKMHHGRQSKGRFTIPNGCPPAGTFPLLLKIRQSDLSVAVFVHSRPAKCKVFHRFPLLSLH